jgi:2'-hydroxyisoflavone reductase
MNRSRRRFLSGVGAVSLGVVSLGAFAGDAVAQDAGGDEKLKILFLGGTGFLGPHTIDILTEHGHEVTLFNRGNRKEMFPELELIVGNRIADIEPGLTPLEEAVASGRRWDAVVDTASVHTWTENSAEVLKGATDHYIYISSLSAYASTSGDGRHEDDELASMPDEVADSIDRLPYDMNYYGAVKARSEAAAQEAFPGAATVIRPGLIVGPRDFTHRFTYWPARVREGGEVLAPGTPDDPVMFIDVRDLAAFLVTVIENDTYGVFNANGPVTKDMTIGKLLEACKETTGSDASFTWADAEFLGSQGVGPWQQMPVWIPPIGEMEGFHKTSLERAKAAGLTTRPVAETIRDTLEWLDGWLPEIKESRGYEYKPGENAAGISRQREAEVLAAWKARDGG